MKTWTTHHLPPREQFSYWREVICEAFATLSPDASSRSDFGSEVVQKDIGGVLVSDSRSRAQSIVRGPREIAHDPAARYFVNYQVTGTCLMRQGDRETLMGPGDFYLVDTLRPYTQQYSDWQVLCLCLPQHMLAPLLADPARATAVRVSACDGGLGAIAGSFIRSLEQCPDTTDSASKELLATGLVNVLAVALGGTADARAQGRTHVARRLLGGIKAHVRRNHADPGLSVAGVAAHFRISPRYLHKLFEGSGETFAQYVLEQRLARVAAALEREDRSASISALAYRAGFGDLSYFCRAFRKRYGVTARAYRANGCDAR